MGGKKTKSTTKTNQTQTNAPPAWTAPGLVDAAGRVTAGMGQIPATHYSGPMQAFMSPEELAAITGAWGNASQQSGDMAAWMQQQMPALSGPAQFAYNGAPGTGTYAMGDRFEGMDATIRAATAPVMDQLMNQILPSIKSSSLDSGAYSGDRAMMVMPGQAIDDANMNMSQIAAQLAYEDYNNFENRRLSAWQGDQDNILQAYGLDTDRGLGVQAGNQNLLQLLPGYTNSILRNYAAEGDLLNMAAQLGITNQQAQIGNAVGMDQYASQAPFMGLDTASQLLAALSGNWGTQTMKGTSTTTNKESPGAMEWVKAAAGLASMAMGMPGMGIGAGASAAGGAGAASSLFQLPGITSPGPLRWPGG